MRLPLFASKNPSIAFACDGRSSARSHAIIAARWVSRERFTRYAAYSENSRNRRRFSRCVHRLAWSASIVELFAVCCAWHIAYVFLFFCFYGNGCVFILYCGLPGVSSCIFLNLPGVFWVGGLFVQFVGQNPANSGAYPIKMINLNKIIMEFK